MRTHTNTSLHLDDAAHMWHARMHAHMHACVRACERAIQPLPPAPCWLSETRGFACECVSEQDSPTSALVNACSGVMAQQKVE